MILVVLFVMGLILHAPGPHAPIALGALAVLAVGLIREMKS